MRSLCLGKIEQEVAFPFPQMRSEERELLQTVIESLDGLLGSMGEQFREWDREGEMPRPFIQQLREFGLFGLVIRSP